MITMKRDQLMIEQYRRIRRAQSNQVARECIRRYYFQENADEA